MAFNYSKLRGRIRERFVTEEEFAKAIGIGRTSLSHRLNGKLEFSQKEINQSIKVLGLTEEDIPAYFFTPKV